VSVPGGGLLAGSIEQEIGSSGCKLAAYLYRSEDGIVWSQAPLALGWSQAALPLSRDTLVYGASGIYLYYNVFANANPDIREKVITFFPSQVTTLVLDPNGEIFASTGPYVQGGEDGGGIYRTKDRGETWEPMNSGLADSTIMDLVQTPFGELLAATLHQGVYSIARGDANWRPLNQGLPSLTTTAIAVTTEGRLFVGTNRGIYRAMQPIDTPIERDDETPGRFRIGQNYPNPFHSITTIPFELPEATPVTLIVIDVLGHEVARVEKGVMGAGMHQMAFDGVHLASGVYLYQVRTRAGVSYGRMAINK
jgi:hypothetical protein